MLLTNKTELLVSIFPVRLVPFRVLGGREASSVFPPCLALRRLAASAHEVSARSLGCGMLRMDVRSRPRSSKLHASSLDANDRRTRLGRPTDRGPERGPERDGHAGAGVGKECYLVDPASSHMLVSKIKPCMCKYELIQTVKLRMAH